MLVLLVHLFLVKFERFIFSFFVLIPVLSLLMLGYLIFRSFDVRRECHIRKYSYLLPAEVIGIKDNCTAVEADHHISDFNDILNTFEV